MAGYEDILSVDYDPNAPALRYFELVNAYYAGGKFYSQGAGPCYAVKVDSSDGKVYDCTATATAADAEITWTENERATNTMALHLADENPHAQYTTAAELAAAVSDHAGAADPHTGYQKETEKGQANGYASLDASTLVPLAELGMAQTKAASGYVKLPGGIIVQWGTVTFSASTTATWTFPLAFPTMPFAVSCHVYHGGAAHPVGLEAASGAVNGPFSKTQAVFRIDSAQSIAGYCIAVGH